ncbi:MAG: MarR family transcriptional regulator [Pseudoxanthomonas sp.]
MNDGDLKGTKRASTTYLIARVFHALRATRIEPILKPFGITPLQYTIMTVIATHEGLSSADLSRRFYVTPQTMGQVLASLEEGGLLKRREDPGNRRVLRVAMTAEGRKLVQRCDKQMEKIELEVFGNLDDSDVEAFRSKLYKVAAVLRGADQVATAVDTAPAPSASKRKRATVAN